MKKRNRKVVLVTILTLTVVVSAIHIHCAEPRIRITQRVGINNWESKEGDIRWAIGDINRIGPGGYAPITWCIENIDPDLSLKGYFVTFIIDPEITMGGDWDMVKEEANSSTGYRWTFGDNLTYGVRNTYILQAMGNLFKTVWNVFTVKDAEKIDHNVILVITEDEPTGPDFFEKLWRENLYGVSLKIPDLEPTTRAGRHRWCIEEGIKLSWYERLKRGEGITAKHVYPKAYVVIGNGAQIGEEHKIVALICSANPDSMWQWTSFNVISYEEVTFVVEKPKVSQWLGIGVFIAFAVFGWYSGLFKKLGKLVGVG